MMDEARTHIEDTLRRIDELSQTLNKSREQSIASTARALLASVLDLHGLALAKIATGLVQTEVGRKLYDALGREEDTKAVLLLHGLHPQSPEERLRAAIPQMEQRLGVFVRLSEVGGGIARVVLSDNGQDWQMLCREVRGAFLDAAPDLDDIAIERSVSGTIDLKAPGETPLAAAE
jgi:hypothetical protein